MLRHLATIARVLLPIALLACGGGAKKSNKPTAQADKTKPAGKETEADRENKRRAAAKALVPEGSTCLPESLKQPGALRLELAAIGLDLIVCALDTDKARLLGPVACWKVDLGSGGLTYQTAAPLPGRGIAVKVDDRCARGYCLPKDASTADQIAHMAWSDSKVAVLIGDQVHIYDSASKAHEISFSIRGDKGVTNAPTAIHWVGETILVEGADETPSSAVWMFTLDGAPIGPIEALGTKDGKPMSTHGGSFSLLDKNRVAVAQQGFSSMTVYEVASSKRSKLVRKLNKPPCKTDELDAYWRDNTAPLSPKCKDHMTKHFEHLIGATAVATAKSFLVMLRGPRLGELGVLDQKTLAEKKVIKLPWCDADAAAPPTRTAPTAAASPARVAPPAAAVENAAGKNKERASKKGSAKDTNTVKGAEDPDAGGQ